PAAARPGGYPPAAGADLPGFGSTGRGSSGVRGGPAAQSRSDRTRPPARRVRRIDENGRACQKMTARTGACLATACILAFGQGMATRNIKPAVRAKASGRPWPSRLTNIAKQAGLTQPAVYGALANVQYLAETSSGGVTLFDYDGDGWLDIFVV